MNLEYKESPPKSIEQVCDAPPGAWTAFILAVLNEDPITYSVYGFWHGLGRRLISLLPFWWRNWWTNHVRTIYAPQHSELRASIPKTWCDIDECIATFLYACIISFVEGEDGLKDWEDPHQDGTRKEQAAMLREVYNWAKTGRAAAGEEAFASVVPGKGFFDGDYTEYRRITESAEERDRRYLEWVVKYREYMWS